MFPSRRAAARSLHQNLSRSSRRYASHSAHADPHHAEPVKESFGKGFYLGFGSPVLFYVLYQLNQSSKQGDGSFVSRLIGKYTEKQEGYQKKMAVHMAAVEQASVDRQIFTTEEKSGVRSGINLRYPEQFNNGSPYNVVAGHSADLSKVMTHYQDKRDKAEEERLARVKDGKISSVYDSKPVEPVKAVSPV